MPTSSFQRQPRRTAYGLPFLTHGLKFIRPLRQDLHGLLRSTQPWTVRCLHVPHFPLYSALSCEDVLHEGRDCPVQPAFQECESACQQTLAEPMPVGELASQRPSRRAEAENLPCWLPPLDRHPRRMFLAGPQSCISLGRALRKHHQLNRPLKLDGTLMQKVKHPCLIQYHKRCMFASQRAQKTLPFRYDEARHVY